MNKKSAFLVVHKLALFNDEWYDDYTLDLGAINPAALFENRTEAEAYVLQQTYQLMRGHSFDELELDELEELALEEALAQPDIFDPLVENSVRQFLASRDIPLPTIPNDSQLDIILNVSGLKMFHILESEASLDDLSAAQSILALTPERPPAVLEFIYDEELEDDQAEEHIQHNDDPAVARLNRVTQLFGRRYASWIGI